MKEKMVIWRDDLDALSFAVFSDGKDHGAACFVHRRAFRILLGSDPVGADCLAHFKAHAEAFQIAARAKIDRRSIPHGRSLNLNSRDIRRALGNLAPSDEPGREKSCRVLIGK